MYVCVYCLTCECWCSDTSGTDTDDLEDAVPERRLEEDYNRSAGASTERLLAIGCGAGGGVLKGADNDGVRGDCLLRHLTYSEGSYKVLSNTMVDFAHVVKNVVENMFKVLQGQRSPNPPSHKARVRGTRDLENAVFHLKVLRASADQHEQKQVKARGVVEVDVFDAATMDTLLEPMMAGWVRRGAATEEAKQIDNVRRLVENEKKRLRRNNSAVDEWKNSCAEHADWKLTTPVITRLSGLKRAITAPYDINDPTRRPFSLTDIGAGKGMYVYTTYNNITCVYM